MKWNRFEFDATNELSNYNLLFYGRIDLIMWYGKLGLLTISLTVSKTVWNRLGGFFDSS